jgi:hypothetical protein
MAGIIGEHQTILAALRNRVPFELVGTNLEGVFASPSPPDDFDPNTARPADLIRNGILWRRPQPGDDPGLVAAWERAFSRRWSSRNRIVPRLEPQPGRTHEPRTVTSTDAGVTSNNWAGGVLLGTWTTALGFWAIPTVSKPTEPQGVEGGWNSASWIGLDGVLSTGSTDVLQAGIEQRVASNGQASYTAWYEWWCALSKQTLGDTSPRSPALASLNGRLYIAWKGHGNDNLNVMYSTDNGQTFGHKFTSPETSPEAPALEVHQGNLYIAWKGDGNDNLNVARVGIAGDTITGFQNKVTLGDTSPLGPALASLNGRLYLAWKGDGNDNLNVMYSGDGGHTFGHKLVSPETSPKAPTLAVHQGSLFIAWKGDGNDNLNVALVGIAGATVTGLLNKVTLGDTSPVSPAVQSFDGRLYLAWKGDGNDNLNLMYSADGGHTFGNKYTSPETSPQPPALVAHTPAAPGAANLFYGWKGDGNDNLNVSVVGLDGVVITGFTTPPYLFQTNITNFSVSPGDTVYCSAQYIDDKSLGYLYFANDTTGEHFSITLTPPPGASFNGTSAEWIMEAPDGGYPNSALPKFTEVKFTTALCCGPNRTVGDPKSGTVWNVVNGAQTLTATTLGSDTVTIDFKG